MERGPEATDEAQVAVFHRPSTLVPWSANNATEGATMPSHRSLRVAEAIREVVSSSILFEVSDPRVTGITVLRSEVSSDLRTATVFVSIMGTDAEQKLAMKGLESAAGFLQAKVAARLQTRTTPHLTFKRDVGIKRSIEMSKMIDDVLANDRNHKSDPLANPEVSEVDES